MDGMNEMGNDAQRMQELRQRININAEKLLKNRMMFLTRGKKGHGKLMIALAIVAAVIVLLEILNLNNLWAFNTFLVAFVMSFLVVEFIMSKIMQSYLPRVINAGTARQHYRAVRRLISIYKLRYWLPFAAAVICGCFFKQNSLGSCAFLIAAVMLSGALGNWSLDEDFCNDVEELDYLITMSEQEG